MPDGDKKTQKGAPMGDKEDVFFSFHRGCRR